MKQKTIIILDLNGVVQKDVVWQVVKFGLMEVLRRNLSAAAFLGLMRKVAPSGGEKSAHKKYNFTPAEHGHVRRFYETGQHLKISLLRGAQSTVKKLLELPDTFIYVCSANKFSDKTDDDYRRFLIDTFGKFEEMHFVKPTESKLEFYTRIKNEFPNDKIIVVDDSPRHIKDAQSLGLETVWINKKHGHKNLNAAFFRK